MTMAHLTKRSLFFIFRQGFLSFFLLDKNPIRQYAKKQKSISDRDKIYSDWCNVGKDIRNATASLMKKT